MARVLSVNVGAARAIAAKSGRSGIDKRPVAEPVRVDVPGAGNSGLHGDVICDTRHHGGPDQAVYAYAREDLDAWEGELRRILPSGSFGENLTTVDLDVTGARIGERWRIGGALLQVTNPRIPCRTFAVWLDRQGWMQTFTAAAVPGAYLRVLEPGEITAGDEIDVVHRPEHDVTIGLTFRALTREHELLPLLLAAGDDLTPDVAERARRRAPFALDGG